MALITKEMKVVLLFNVIAALIYGILYFFIPDATALLTGHTRYDPQFFRLWGATCIALAIFGLLAIKRAEWENIKILIELAIVWLILALIANFISLATLTYSQAGLVSQWFDNIVIIIIIIVDTFFYIRESRLT